LQRISEGGRVTLAEKRLFTSFFLPGMTRLTFPSTTRNQRRNEARNKLNFGRAGDSGNELFLISARLRRRKCRASILLHVFSLCVFALIFMLILSLRFEDKFRIVSLRKTVMG
jgi:hypothetical protein